MGETGVVMTMIQPETSEAKMQGGPPRGSSNAVSTSDLPSAGSRRQSVHAELPQELPQRTAIEIPALATGAKSDSKMEILQATAQGDQASIQETSSPHVPPREEDGQRQVLETISAMIKRLSERGEFSIDFTRTETARKAELMQDHLDYMPEPIDTQDAEMILRMILLAPGFRDLYPAVRFKSDIAKRVPGEVKSVFERGLVTALEAAALIDFGTAANRRRRELFKCLRDYRNRLRALIEEDEVWQSRFAKTDEYCDDNSGRTYEEWLLYHSPEASHLPSQKPCAVDVSQPLLPAYEFGHISTAAELRLNSQGSACGAVILREDDLTLRWMCELGVRLHIDPAFFVDHICRPHQLDLHKIDNNDRTEAFALDGVAASVGPDRCFLMRDAGFVVGPKTDSTHQRLSCSRLDTTAINRSLKVQLPDYSEELEDSFFIVLFKNSLCTTREEPPKFVQPTYFQKTFMIPTNALNLYNRAGLFFNDAWNSRRLSELTTGCDNQAKRHTLAWLLTISALETEIKNMATFFGAMDSSVITSSSIEALHSIKNYRTQVAVLRQNLTETWRASQTSSEPRYWIWRKPGKKVDDEKKKLGSAAITSRQRAASSHYDEYVWIDQQAADLMPLLNESLQIVLAEITLEQTQQGLKETNAANRLAEQSLELSRQSARLAELMARDSAISIKNSERSTMLTLLAAIYLPLSLATGIFGMNIQEIGDSAPKWWAVVSVAAGLLLPTVVAVLFVFARGRQNRQQEERKNENT